MSNGKQSDDLFAELAGVRAVLDEVGAYIYTKDRQGRYTYANRYVQELFGAPLEHILGRDDRDFFDLSLSDQLKAHDALVMEQGMTIEREEVNFVKPSGEQRIYWTVKKPTRNAAGEIVGMCGISTDITERKAMEAKLVEQHRLLETILSHADAYIYMKDANRCFRYVNPKVAQLFGMPQHLIHGKRDVEVLPPAFADHLWDLDKKVFESGRPHSGEESVPDAGGGMRHYWSVKVPIHLDHDVPTLIGFSTDITELYQLKEQLRRQSTIDELTGLYNRRHFFEAMEKELARARRQNSPTALLLMDVDFFKAINDAHGHPAGDRVLTCLGQTLLQNVRGEDTVARVGGEEFAVLLPNTRLDAAEALAERIRHAVANEGVCCPQGKHLAVTLSIGLAQSVDGEGTVDELYCLADRLLYQAKQQGRNRVCMAA